MDIHRTDYKNWQVGKHTKVNSFILFDKYGVENCNIVLLELVNVETKDELHAREAFYIKSLKCLNKYIPLRTKQEYYTDNKEKIDKQTLDNYYKNKEYVLNRQAEKCLCECGKYYTHGHKSRHIKSQRHLDNIN